MIIHELARSAIIFLDQRRNIERQALLGSPVVNEEDKQGGTGVTETWAVLTTQVTQKAGHAGGPEVLS